MNQPTILPLPPPEVIAGFWRRILAFVLDLFILGLIGLGLGTVLSEQFIELGPWGRLVGFTIAFVYFGLLNSKLTGGQTPAKRLLRIKVVGGDGAPLSLGKSFLRFLPLGNPFFLNNAQFSAAVLLSPLMYVLSAAIFGLGLSVLYLYIFNRKTRQSLHDILVRSYVVPSETPVAAAPTAWRGHYVVCGVLLLATAVLPYFTMQLVAHLPWNQMLAVIQAVEQEPWVIHTQVEQGVNSFAVGATVRTNEVASEARAAQLAAKVLEHHAGADSFEVINISLQYGYDIGIATWWNSQGHAFSPKEWRDKIARTAG